MNLIKRLEERKLELLEMAKELRDNNPEKIDEAYLESISGELRDIDEALVELKKEERDNTVEVVVDNKEEKREMSKENREVRALANFIKGEVRADDEITVTNDGKATIPTLVENTIVEKMDLYSDVFAKARKLPSQAGSLKIPRENSIAIAGFVGELEDVEAIKLDLGEVELNQKRVGAFTRLTNQLVNDAAVDIIGYAEDNLARGAARAIEQNIFGGKGDAAKQFKGITEDTDVEVVSGDAIDLDTLITLHNKLHPGFLNDAAFYVSTEIYDAISKLKDGNGHPYVQNGIVNGELTKTLFDSPIVVTDYLPEDKPVVFGSIAQGYTIMIKEGMKLEHITNDMANAIKGTQTLVLDAYMDGAVHDPQAFVVLESTTTGE